MRRRRNPFPIFLSFFVVIVLLSGSLMILYNLRNTPTHKSVLSTSEQNSMIASPTPPPILSVPPDNEALARVIDQELEGTTATYSAVIKNFKTGHEYYLAEHKRYTAASLYKLWVMGKVYDLVKNDQLKEDLLLTGDVATLNKRFQISSDSAELKEGNLKMSISDALDRMITYSDNYSALLLTQKIKLSTMPAYLQANNFSETLISNKNPVPYTTAHDVAQFFEKLYFNSLSDQSYNEKMLNLLKSQTIRRKLPRLLPKNIEIAHKTGELDSYTHDAGIVYTPKGDYLIVVMSRSNQPNAAETRIANISNAVYKFFNSL